jgi:hypothetical protein
MIAKLDSSGSLAWQYQSHDSSLLGSYDYATLDITSVVRDGYLYVAGRQHVLKIPTDGSLDTSGAEWGTDNTLSGDAFTSAVGTTLSAVTRSDGDMSSAAAISVTASSNLALSSFTPPTYAESDLNVSTVTAHPPGVASLPQTLTGVTSGWSTLPWISQVARANELYQLSETKGASQAVKNWVSDNNPTVAQYPYYGHFVAPPLAAAVTLSSDVVLSFARSVADTALNFTAAAAEIYVWRPSTGSVVGVLRKADRSRVGGAPTAASTEQASYGTSTVDSVSAQPGDQIVVDWYGRQDNTSAASYSTTVYYDGATDTGTTDNATVSDFAAYVQFGETLSFAQAHELAANAQASATFVANSGTTVSAAALSAASLTGDMLLEVLLSAAAAAQSSVPQSLMQGALPIAAAASAAATLAPNLLQTTALAAQAAASATVAADVSTVVVVYLAADSVAGSTAMAALANAPLLAAQLLAGSSAQAALDKSAPLSAQAASLATFSLSLVSDISLAAAGQATASLDPNLRYAVLLAAEGMDTTTAAAAIDLACNMLAGASAESLVAAGLSLDVPLQVAVLGQASLTAVLRRAILPDFLVYTRYMAVLPDPHAVIVASEVLAA